MICATLSLELEVVHALKNSTLCGGMNDLEYHEHKPLDAMSSSALWMI